ncbi:MAG TPA: glycosyltransferase [Archaeoglobus sp.]|nr:glycosyltransferase [Archaeoglobus sp.]
MKLKLMQITHDLAIGGLQQVVVNLCKFINKEKFNVSVLCLRALGPFTDEVRQMGIKVHFLPQPQNGTDYFSFLKVAKILRKEEIDIIHTHNTQPFVDGTLGALLSGRRITIVHTDHARDFPDKRRYMFAEWLMSHFAYKVVCVSEHTCQNLIKYEKISPKKVLTILNGIDGSKFDMEIDREQKKRELGLSGYDPIIGLGVRLTEQKGITYLLQAMPEVIKHFPNIALVIAGEGPLEEDLKKEAELLGIKRHVHFVGPRLDMPELLKLFDLYVLPSLWEGLPMVLLEAMTAGCPIVATNVGGVPAALRHDKSGVLVPPADPETLGLQIVKLLDDVDARKRYSENGIKIFHEKFSAENMIQKYEEVYNKS